jgi:hypothetical protein
MTIMATQTAGSSDFIKNLGKMYGTYTGGFIGFIILLAILEQAGVSNKILGYLFVGFTIAVYAVIGVMTRTAQISEYYVAGRRVPAFYNGMATRICASSAPIPCRTSCRSASAETSRASSRSSCSSAARSPM